MTAIFINYRREESGHFVGRLRDRLAEAFGRNTIFMDVDNVPAGFDFDDYLRSQIDKCDAMLSIVGPNWLNVKDETGRRRLDNPKEDYVAIEIEAALARKIPVIPVLVDGARMPKAAELPDSLKLFARRNALEVRHSNFDSDAEALVKKVRGALGYDSAKQAWRARTLMIVAAMAVLFLVGWAGYEFIVYMKTDIEGAFRDVRQQAERDQKAAVEAAVKAEQERQARAVTEAEAKRKAEEAEQQRLAAESFRDRLVDGQPCSACPEMVVVPAGDVIMGSPEKERGSSDEESPQHRVTIANPLAIGKFSVTRGEFAAFVRETAYTTEGGCDVWNGSEWRHQSDRSWRSFSNQDDRHPVVCINWHDAKAFAAWLSKKVGKTYRLLTEAEREYAARAKTATRYSFGDDEARLSQYAWYQANSGGATHPVGEKKPNAFGLFDMHGNVWAWCEDTWHSSYHGAPNDGSAWQTGDTALRVLRGGSWYRNANGLRSAFRIKLSPDGRYSDVGFRVARGLLPSNP